MCFPGCIESGKLAALLQVIFELNFSQMKTIIVLSGLLFLLGQIVKIQNKQLKQIRLW
jgi:hypothetical protein